MDQKMDSVLRVLMEQFPPKPQLTPQPSIRRVTIQKRMGVSIDEGPWWYDDVITKGELKNSHACKIKNKKNKGTKSSKILSLSLRFAILNSLIDFWPLRREQLFNCPLAAALLWDSRGRECHREWDSWCRKKADWPLSSDDCRPCLGFLFWIFCCLV